MADGQPAPVSLQYADDTTLHVLQPSDAQQVSGFSGPSTAPCLSLSKCRPQHQLHHRPTDHQTSWGCLGLRHAGSLSFCLPLAGIACHGLIA